MTAAVIRDDLTDLEAGTLIEHERTIERGLKTFVEVGRALAAIRDGRLYRTEYASFEAYCDVRWAISRPRAYQLIEAAEVVSTTVDTGYRPPANEAQARELARASSDERSDVWREANERSNGRPTAAMIREVVRERQAPPSTSSGRDLPPDPQPEPERPKPPKWDPEERRAHEEEVRRRQDIESARRTATTLVTTIRAEVLTVLAGYRLGERDLITQQDIADIRAVVDLLDKEISNED